MLGRAWFRPACVTWILSENGTHYNNIRRSLSFYSHLHLSRHPGAITSGTRYQLPGVLLPASNQINFNPVRNKHKNFRGVNKRGEEFENVNVALQNSKETAEIMVRAKFEEDKELSGEEWDQLTIRIIGLPDSNGRLVKPVNLSSFILQTCIKMQSINVGKSWVEYYRLFDSADAVKLDPVLKLVHGIEDMKDQQEFVLKVAWFYLSLGLEGVATAHQYWDSLQLLAKTDEWEKGVEMILANENRHQKRNFEGMLQKPKRGEYATDLIVEENIDRYQNHLVRATVPFCIRALKSNRFDYVDKLMTREQFHEFQVPLRYYSDPNNLVREKVYEFILIYSQEIKDKSAGVMLRHRLYEYFNKYDVHITRELARVLMDTLYMNNKRNVEKEFTHRTRIDYITGKCATCGNKLQRTELTDEEFSTLKKAVYETVLVSGDIYKSSDPKELKQFMKAMESDDEKYDVVIDGLNVSYHLECRII